MFSLNINKHINPKGDIIIIPIPKNTKETKHAIYNSILNRNAELQKNNLIRIVNLGTESIQQFIRKLLTNCNTEKQEKQENKNIQFKSYNNHNIKIYTSFSDIQNIDLKGYNLTLDHQEKMKLLLNKKLFPDDMYYIVMYCKTPILNNGIGIIYYDDNIDYYHFPIMSGGVDNLEIQNMNQVN